MGKRYGLDFQFPVKGLEEGASYERQPPYSSPDLQNVRAFDITEERVRGGQRPGLEKVFSEQLGSGNPMRMLSQVTFVEGTTASTQEFSKNDVFRREGSDLGAAWSTATWIATSMRTTLGASNYGYAYVLAADGEGGNVWEDQDYDETEDYNVGVRVVRDGPTHDGYYRLFVRMDDSSPDAEDEGLIAQLLMSGSNAYSGNLYDYNDAGDLKSTTAFSTGSIDDTPAWFEVYVSGDDITVKLDGTTIATKTVTSHAGTRMGFGLEHVSVGDENRTDVFRLRGIRTVTAGGALPIRKTRIVASSNGTVYEENPTGTLTSVAGAAADLSTDHLIHAIERGQKLYIADYGGYKITDVDGTVSGTTLDDTGVNWNNFSIDTDNDIVYLFETGDADNQESHTIASIAGDGSTLTLGASSSLTGAITYIIVRAPKIYNPADSTVSIWNATSGALPVGCKCIALYRDRMVLAGHEYQPHAWYMSKQGDPYDWDYTDTTDSRAVRGALEVAGRIGRIITATMPYTDDFLVFACPNSLFVLRGDPAWGGLIDPLSQTVGCIDTGAWCFGPLGEIYFLDSSGLYRLPPNPQGHMPPEPISLGKMPTQLQGISETENTVLLEWNEQETGVNIFVTPVAADPAVHWFYDLRTDSFWKDSNASAHGPTAIWNYRAAEPTERGLLLGGRDGYVRGYALDAKSDDGTAISSYVRYQPLRLSQSMHTEGILLDMDGSLAHDSDDVTWELFMGDRNEDAAKQTSAFASGTWTGNSLQYRERPRARGGSVCLKLSNPTLAEGWAIESVVGTSEGRGRHRKA